MGRQGQEVISWSLFVYDTPLVSHLIQLVRRKAARCVAHFNHFSRPGPIDRAFVATGTMSAWRTSRRAVPDETLS